MSPQPKVISEKLGFDYSNMLYKQWLLKLGKVMLFMAVVWFLWNTSGIKFMDITKTSQSYIHSAWECKPHIFLVFVFMCTNYSNQKKSCVIFSKSQWIDGMYGKSWLYITPNFLTSFWMPLKNLHVWKCFPEGILVWRVEDQGCRAHHECTFLHFRYSCEFYMAITIQE